MVIQRLQNLYMLLSAIIAGMFAFITLFEITLPSGVSAEISCLGIAANAESGLTLWPISITLAVLAIAFPVITIAKFKSLKSQKSLCAMTIVIHLGLAAYMAIATYQGFAEAAISPVYSNLALIVIVLILDFMALKGIKHDIKLLSDSNRIR